MVSFPSLSNINSCMAGISLGTGFSASMNVLNGYRQAGNPLPTAFYQSSLISSALRNVAKIFEAVNKPGLISPRISWALWLTPLAVGGLQSMSISNHTVRQIVNFTHEHLDTVILVATAVSCVALFVLGHQVYAVTSLTLLALGTLERASFLPESICTKIRIFNFFAGSISGLYFGTTFTRLLSVVNLTYTLSRVFFPHIVTAATPKDEPTVLTPDLLKNILHKGAVLSLNKGYMTRQPCENIPDYDLAELNTLFDSINWNDPSHLNALKMKLKQDQKWEKSALSISDNPNKEIDYIKAQMKAFVTLIKNRKIPGVADYAILDVYCKNIIHTLKQLEKDPKIPANEKTVTLVDIFLQLAIDGGDYCGLGIAEAIEKANNRLIGNAEQTTLSTKEYILLQQMRRRIVQGIVSSRVEELKKEFPLALDLNDLNIYPTIVNMFGAQYHLGILSNGSASDPLSNLTRMVISSFYPDLNETFNYSYDVISCTAEIRNAVGTSAFPKADFFEICKKWVIKYTPELNELQTQLNDIVIKLVEAHGEEAKSLDVQRKAINQQILNHPLIANLSEDGRFVIPALDIDVALYNGKKPNVSIIAAHMVEQGILVPKTADQQ